MTVNGNANYAYVMNISQCNLWFKIKLNFTCFAISNVWNDFMNAIWNGCHSLHVQCLNSTWTLVNANGKRSTKWTMIDAMT